MKSLTTKAYQWVEGYRSCTDGEIKTILKNFYKMGCWQDLHVALWAWLSLDGEREKADWFKKFDVPKGINLCFACEVAKKCVNCPLPRKKLRGAEIISLNSWCANGLYEKWVDTHKIAEREKLAREIATMKWEERL